jgi:formylglycine-generating enzyme required for sulfatase activity
MKKSTMVVLAVCVMEVSNFASADIFGTGSNQFTIDFVPISGDTNPTSGYGIVNYDYRMSTNEITNDQWNKFQNEYGSVTGSPTNAYNGSSYWTGADVPTNSVSWYEAAQFVNWLNSSTGHQVAYKFTGTQGTDDYTFTPCVTGDDGYNANNPYRNSNAYYFLPNEDEWVKAAYWNGTMLQTYATSDNSLPIEDVDSNYGFEYDSQPWDVGSGSEELNGTFNMMGNVAEWLESPYYSGDYLSGSYRGVRGGSYNSYDDLYLRSSRRSNSTPSNEINTTGFRIASVHEPATLLLIGLEIEGPSEVAEESSVQYTAIAVYDNNSTEDVTDQAIWTVVADNYADINGFGLLNTYELVMPTEDTTIYAQYEEGNDVVQAEKDVQIYALCTKGAIELDGIDDFVRLPYNEPVWLPEHNFSISLWAYCERDYGVAMGPESFLDLNNAEEGSYNGENGCHLLRNTSNGKILFRMATLTDVDDNLLSESSIEPGRWYHIVAVRDGGWQGIYIDGQLDNSRTCTTDPIKYQGTYDNDSVTIGKSSSKANPSSDFLKGFVDEVMIFNRALSSGEVTDLMYFGISSDPNLVGYWAFNEGQGQIAYDSSGNGNDGYLGDDPCNADSADPCWVETGAPSRCTASQMIARNVSGALDDKAAAAELIDSALEKEKASAKLLIDGTKRSKKSRRERWNSLWSAREIYRSIGFEYQCRDKLLDSIEALERALQWLFDEAVSTQPGKQGKAINSSERK